MPLIWSYGNRLDNSSIVSDYQTTIMMLPMCNLFTLLHDIDESMHGSDTNSDGITRESRPIVQKIKDGHVIVQYLYVFGYWHEQNNLTILTTGCFYNCLIVTSYARCNSGQSFYLYRRMCIRNQSVL